LRITAALNITIAVSRHTCTLHVWSVITIFFDTYDIMSNTYSWTVIRQYKISLHTWSTSNYIKKLLKQIVKYLL